MRIMSLDLGSKTIGVALSDELTITTWLSELTQEGAVRHTTVTRAADGELLAQGYARWGCADMSTRTAIAVPPAFADALNQQSMCYQGTPR